MRGFTADGTPCARETRSGSSELETKSVLGGEPGASATGVSRASPVADAPGSPIFSQPLRFCPAGRVQSGGVTARLFFRAGREALALTGAVAGADAALAGSAPLRP